MWTSPFLPFLMMAFEYSPSASLSISIPSPLNTLSLRLISSSTSPLLTLSPPSTPCSSSSCKRAWRSTSCDDRRSDSISKSLADFAIRNFWVSRVAISDAWAVDECDERVSRWWLLRVVRVLESSVLLLVLLLCCHWFHSYFSVRYRLPGLAGRVLVEELQGTHLCVKLRACQARC